ncbi:MAG TPA: Rpn family recombination-promoting nuclease/putative transposase [Blastocatellia bacterium]|nr:Rpn family recombination-promoting nuclease/putative transposase [Blastocatellia bacterium]HMV86320.1 Rpn family recombination-promoting nuclease/putative transposase [Blastocatellia bacterium]HMX25961.1 Rpn family recombination-promoting nuclease/putative transposase [Blastocatellia bacterium]HMY76155.1 Rpn family recombination-promoting nuclease/putative transposase [Blastocatellia bacterium]HNG31298.1 Rpn family recombination-promoting nuclease/putative transposase [Blastocatellia bacteri
MPSRKRVPNPHDAFFRRVFSDPAVAAEFLCRYLPPAISAALDLTRIELEETSLTDQRLRRHAADLLFRVRLIGGGEAYILILLEHKSTPDERVALQVLRYSVLKWDRMALPLPLIIPVVVYHGAKPWSIGKKLSDLFGQFSGSRIWRRYLPDFEYHLCDLSKFRDEELEGGEGLGAVLKLLKHIFRPDLKETLLDAIHETAETLPEPSVKERIETLVTYVEESGQMTGESIEKILFDASREGGKMDNILLRIGRRYNPEAVETAAQEALARGLEQGLERGMERGLERGMEKAILELTESQLERKLGKLDKASLNKVRRLPITGLKQLGMDLLDFQSHAELETWLQQHAQPTEYKN